MEVAIKIPNKDLKHSISATVDIKGFGSTFIFITMLSLSESVTWVVTLIF